jgi:hypothetical protein
MTCLQTQQIQAGIMTQSRIAAVVLSLLLLGLWIWSFINGVRDPRLHTMLGIGVSLGALYAANGQLPKWITSASSGHLTADDDPANISPRLYLPILTGVIIIAILVFGIGLLLV